MGLSLAAGCGTTPMAPSRDAALSLVVSNLNNVRDSFLGASQNEILFHLDGPGAPSGHGVYGPFSTTAATGSVTVAIKVPSGPGTQVLSVQLNDAVTHQPLALGAVQFEFGSSLSAGLTVTLGSVARNCYFTDLSLNPGVNNLGPAGYIYLFASDLQTKGVAFGTGSDIAFDVNAGQFFIEDAYNLPPAAAIIAYLGKGDMVDNDHVPATSLFFVNSFQAKAAMGAPVTTVEKDDIYCIRAQSLKGGWAWIQITDPGSVGSTGPSFRFRVNTTVPYYAYEQTTADLNGSCGVGY